MKWTFNLEKPPLWGGIFERLVRSVKRCLKKTIGGARLTYDCGWLLTVDCWLLTVDCGWLWFTYDCRPLSYVTSEDLEEPITPSHLLCGPRLMSVPDSCTSETPDYDPEIQPQYVDRRIEYSTWTMLWTTFGRDGDKSILQSCETLIVTPPPRATLTELCPLEM